MASTDVPRKLRDVLADAYTFVRSVEANAAFATVTLEELIGDQIKRNGESSSSNSHQYNPYSYDEKGTTPASQDQAKRVNFLGGADTLRPTKLDRVLAIKNQIVSVVQETKKSEPLEVASAEEYASSVETGTGSESEELQWLYKLKS